MPAIGTCNNFTMAHLQDVRFELNHDQRDACIAWEDRRQLDVPEAYEHDGDRRNPSFAEAEVDKLFRAAFGALTALYRDDRVEEYLAGSVEDQAVELAAGFGYGVNSIGELVETPSCGEEGS
jgi:hypothetical protein